jgi:hypothetical protein
MVGIIEEPPRHRLTTIEPAYFDHTTGNINNGDDVVVAFPGPTYMLPFLLLALAGVLLAYLLVVHVCLVVLS